MRGTESEIRKRCKKESKDVDEVKVYSTGTGTCSETVKSDIRIGQRRRMLLGSEVILSIISICKDLAINRTVVRLF